MKYAAIFGGCLGCATPAGAALAGIEATGTIPHALILCMGDTLRAAEAFDRHIDQAVNRIALVDTFKDEAEESLRLAEALGDMLWGFASIPRASVDGSRPNLSPKCVPGSIRTDTSM